MIRPETQSSRLLMMTANLLINVAEAAWTNNMPSPARWDLHRIGTDAYLAHRGILEVLGRHGVSVEPQADLNIAAALDEAAEIVARLPEEFHTLVTQRLQERVTSLAERVIALRHSIRLGEDSGPLA
jgi:hypothetical protein